MDNNDQALRGALQTAQQCVDGPVPGFAKVYGAAERQLRKRRRVQFASLATIAASVMLAIGLIPSEEDEFTYVHVEELAATIYWSAPSDALLPVHTFDIYREIPEIFESTDMSTNADAGALL